MDVHMTSHPDSDPNCPEKKGPWSPEEDERLRQAVGSSSPRPKWAEIANQVEGRSAKQCRERWEQNLSPRLNKCPINRGEGLYIIEFVDNHGKKWAEIARQLTDRSDNNIKNWYNGMVQKGKTGRGPQEDALRMHFSPEHQMYLANRGRKAPSPTLDPRHPHGYHPYSSNTRAGSYPMAAAPYAPGYANHPYSAPPQMHGYPHHAQQSAEHHRLSAPVLPPPGSLAPIHQHQPPTQSLRLPPLQSPAATGSPHYGHEQRPDYFGQPDWHSRGLTVQTSLQSEHSQASSSSSSHMSTVSPTSRGRAESQELPTLSGSTASTPLGGSPLTPALPQSEVYRHRRSSRTSSNMDYDPSPKEAAKPTMADQGKKMSIMNLVN